MNQLGEPVEDRYRVLRARLTSGCRAPEFVNTLQIGDALMLRASHAWAGADLDLLLKRPPAQRLPLQPQLFCDVGGAPSVTPRSSRHWWTIRTPPFGLMMSFPEFVDLAAPQIWTILLDHGTYLASISVKYRPQRTQDMIREQVGRGHSLQGRP